MHGDIQALETAEEIEAALADKESPIDLGLIPLSIIEIFKKAREL